MLSLYGGRGMQIVLRFVEVEILNYGASLLRFLFLRPECIDGQLALVDEAESKPSTVCC
jgi:hypothetical protein